MTDSDIADRDGDIVARLRRDYYVKDGDVLHRRRDVDRFLDGQRPEASCKIWNTRNADRPVGTIKNGRRMIRWETRFYAVDEIIRIIETGVAPIETPRSGNPYHDDIHIGEGPLGSLLKQECDALGLRYDDLTVLSRHNDPFRLDTAAAHRDAAWFAEHFNQHVAPLRTIHLRGFHYILVSAGGVLKPDGSPYQNTEEDHVWLLSFAAKRARWLGYVGFDQFTDERNEGPVVWRPSPSAAAAEGRVFASLGHSFAEIPSDTEIGDCRPRVWLAGGVADEPYCFAYFGEKTSLADVLEPLARRHHANMYLCAGEMSDTLIWQMARDASADGRPLIVFTFSDFDPAGVQMPVSIGRKLQALKALHFPNLRGQVVPVALTLEHVLQFRLPTTPVKQGDKRRDQWQQAYGPTLYEAGLIDLPGQAAQVEIDALAALRPRDLERIAEAAIAPYWDATLNLRSYEAQAQWQSEAQVAVDAAIDKDAFDDIKRRGEGAAKRFNGALERLRKAQDQLSDLSRELGNLSFRITLPDPPDPVEPEIDETLHDPLIDLDWTFAGATRALKARKAYDDDEG